MNQNKPSSVIRFLPSLTDVAFLLPIVFLFLRMDGAKSMLGDGDTGWHIRTGEWILQNGRVPTTDLFSFTKPGEPWYAWEWLWDVVFAWLHIRWGMAAVVLASVLVIAVTSALLFRLARRKCANLLIAIAVTLLAVAATSLHWLARPHLFSLLFVVVFYSILERARDGRIRLLVWLPLLTVLWTNLHGGFFVGIILVATYGAGELLAAVVEPQVRLEAGLARSKPYWLAALGCAAASFVNPYFYHLHVHIFRYLTEPYHRQHITEFFSISFQHPIAMYFEPMILLGIAAVFWNFYRKRLVYSILLIGWAHLALFAARNIPVFVILAAPAVAQMLHEILVALEAAPVAAWLRRAAKAATDFAAEIDEMDRVGRVHLVSLAGFALVAALCYAPAPPKKFVAEYDTASYPAKAVKILQGPEFAKSVFTHDEWGDYLIYRLYPKTKVFIDGRSDFYGATFGKKFLETMNGRYDWETNLNRYGVETVLLPVGASLASTLKESKRWRVIHDDGTAIVFRLADRAWNPGPASLADAQRSLTGNSRGVGGQNPKVVKSEDLGRGSAITKRRKATT